MARTRSQAISASACAAGIVAIAAAWAVTAAGAAPTVDLLRQGASADDHVSYSGTITTLVYGPHGADATVVRVEHLAPDKWRMWYVAPADAYGRLIVSNEATTYQYEPRIATVYSDDFAHAAPALTLDLDTSKVVKNYTVDAGPAAEIAGRKTISLSLVSRYSGALAQRVWLDAVTKLVLQRETYSAEGSIDTKTTFDNIRIVSKLPKELFDLTIPAGMHVTPGTAFAKSSSDLHAAQQGVGFQIEQPTFVPKGFSFDQASVGTRGDTRTVQLLYTDGLRDFSIFENDTNRLPDLADAKSIDIDGSAGVTDKIAGETLLSLNADGLNITLVGDMPAKMLAKICASIKRR